MRCAGLALREAERGGLLRCVVADGHQRPTDSAQGDVEAELFRVLHPEEYDPSALAVVEGEGQAEVHLPVVGTSSSEEDALELLPLLVLERSHAVTVQREPLELGDPVLECATDGGALAS